MNQSIASTFQQRRLKEVAVLLAGLILLLGLATLLLHQIAERTWLDGFYISNFGAVALIVISIMFKRSCNRRTASAVLLDLGPAPQLPTALKMSFGLHMLISAFILIVGLITPDQSRLLWLGGFFILAPAISWISTGGGYQICENGLLLTGILIRWPDIRRYEWSGVYLWIHSENNLVRFSDCRISIPEDQQEAVGEMLRKHATYLVDQESESFTSTTRDAS